MSTISKRYYQDPWLQTLDTKVRSSQAKGEQHLVVLEETIFYPTGGGQPHDFGTINGVPIVDVFEENGVVYHLLAGPIDAEDASLRLDWPRRLDHMQQHSGQHLLSSILEDEYGYQTESFHLGQEYCSIDIATPSLAKKEQETAEMRANEIIFADLPLLTYTLEAEDKDQVALRKVPDLEGPLRIVEIQDLDYSPCSGTHVDKTGQIGSLKITKTENYKGMTRLYFLCGQRAFSDYKRKHERCSDLVRLLSIPETELYARISAELEHKQALEKQIQTLKTELVALQAQAIVQEQSGPYYLDLPGADIEDAKRLARAILERTTAGVVITAQERVLLAHNLPGTIHLGQFVQEHAPVLGGRGGGSPSSAQVYFAEAAQLEEFLLLLKSSILFD